jgi:DNA-binding MarR family transcriptional regulator
VQKREAKKLIQRTRHPTDTSAKVLVLYPISEQRLQAALPLVEQLDAAYFAACNQPVLITQLQQLHQQNSTIDSIKSATRMRCFYRYFV